MIGENNNYNNETVEIGVYYLHTVHNKSHSVNLKNN